jgi:hypothetical protein
VINAVSTEVATTDHPVIYKTEQPQRTADKWARFINDAWQKSVETILETGQRIIEAKGDLDYGVFWGTLYALATKLPAELLEAKIADGTITPEIERKDVALLRNGSAAHGKGAR